MFPSFFSMILDSRFRSAFKTVLKSVSSKTNKSRLAVGVDILYSGIAYGSTAQEYENLHFYERTHENRATFITTYYNIGNYRRLNARSDREYFRDKLLFNQTFSDFIGREWILINKEEPQVFLDFLQKHGTVIVKPRFGDSGKGITFLEWNDQTSTEGRDLTKRYSGFLAEEVLVNHEGIRKLNPASLNTIRIISVVTKYDVEFLYAGIRIGAPKTRVDNISQGGKIAAIDLNTGLITSGFFSKSTNEVAFKAGDYEGLEIPCWGELLDFVKRAALVVSGTRYIAWDVAVTPNGPALIEGNHSSGNTITQASIDTDSPGLRPRIEEILKKC